MAVEDPPKSKAPGTAIRQAALAFELPVMLVAPAVIGGAVGYFLDRWLHTRPMLMIVLGILGVALGIWDAVRVASAGDKT